MLSDSARRARYDMGEEEDGLNGGGGGGFTGGGMNGMNVDLAELFAQMHGTGGFGAGMGGRSHGFSHGFTF